MSTKDLLAGIARFQDRFRKEQDLFHRLATEGQSPEVLVIACSDSRVPPEVLTDAKPGDLFVVRNVANVVPPYGTGEMAVGAAVEYAVLHLHVKQIMVFGHTDCGGIKALAKPVNWSHEPHIARWIEHARPAQTKVEASGLPPEDKHLATVRENVLLQLEHLRSYDSVRTAERAGSLSLHGWVYHLESGSMEAYDPGSGRWQELAPAA